MKGGLAAMMITAKILSDEVSLSRAHGSWECSLDGKKRTGQRLTDGQCY